MLTRVEVQSENPFYLNIRDARPTDSIIVAKIEGLGPPDIDIFMGDYARDGGYYSGRRVPPRDVIYTLEYNPNYKLGESVSGLRKMLYKAFLDPFVSGDNVNIVLKDDEMADRLLSGYTSKFDGDIFSDDTAAQITMRHPNPYLVDASPTSLVAFGPTMPFEYKGSAETGFVTELTMTSDSAALVLNLNGKSMTFSYPFLSGDRVVIDTRRGSRRVSLTRTSGSLSVTAEILYSLTSGTSSWLELHSEDNTLKVWGATSSTIVANLSKVSFNAQHWGI